MASTATARPPKVVLTKKAFNLLLEEVRDLHSQTQRLRERADRHAHKTALKLQELLEINWEMKVMRTSDVYSALGMSRPTARAYRDLREIFPFQCDKICSLGTATAAGKLARQYPEFGEAIRKELRRKPELTPSEIIEFVDSLQYKASIPSGLKSGEPAMPPKDGSYRAGLRAVARELPAPAMVPGIKGDKLRLSFNHRPRSEDLANALLEDTTAKLVARLMKGARGRKIVIEVEFPK